jgi:SAM-dependent methyltransferase
LGHRLTSASDTGSVNIAVQQAPTSDVTLVCPRCKGALVHNPESSRCTNCAIEYPTLFGIPDFRLRPDRYLTLEEERAKAGRVYEFGKNASLADTVQFYYSITYDLPPNLVQRYQAAILAAPERAQHILGDLNPQPDADLLVEFGCGTGGLLAAAQGSYQAIYGVDMALRWLVICQKRLRERNAAATLICADVEALPFADASFTQGVAADLVDHVYDIDRTLHEIGRTLKPGALFWLSAANRFCPGPHPLTGVWATGFLPKQPRAWLLRKLKGIDLLRYANLVSPANLVRRLRQQGFDFVQAKPKGVHESVATGYAPVERRLIALYRLALRLPLMRSILLWIGPGFEIICSKPDSSDACDHKTVG